MTRALGAPRPALAALLIASVALVAPAAARASDWHQAAAGIPAGVKLNDVATYTPSGGTPVVIAVGQDTVTKQPVVYRLAGGVLTTETVEPPATPPPAEPPASPAQPEAELTHVSATDQGAAWAIGTSKDIAGNETPMIVRYKVDSGTWEQVTPVPFTGQPTALALFGETGLVGDEDGGIWGLDDAGVEAKIEATPDIQGRVTGIAMYAEGTGLATVDNPSPGPRLYEISPSGAQAAVVVGNADDLARPLVSVAAVSADNAIALDGTGVWKRASGVWTRESSGFAFSGQVTLNDAAAAVGGDATPRFAIAGAADGTGAAWRRQGAGAWAPDRGATSGPGATPLSGIAAAPTGELWAVDTGGTLLHYTPPPPPAPAPPPPPDPPPSEQQADSSGQEQPPAPSSDEPPSSSPPIAVTVADQPPTDTGEPTGDSKPPRRGGRLLDSVTVKLAGHKLIVRFRLRARARVGVIAKRGRRVVGRRAMRVMNKGRARIVMRYRGRQPPTELKIVAHAVKK